MKIQLPILSTALLIFVNNSFAIDLTSSLFTPLQPNKKYTYITTGKEANFGNLIPFNIYINCKPNMLNRKTEATLIISTTNAKNTSLYLGRLIPVTATLLPEKADKATSGMIWDNFGTIQASQQGEINQRLTVTADNLDKLVETVQPKAEETQKSRLLNKYPVTNFIQLLLPKPIQKNMTIEISSAKTNNSNCIIYTEIKYSAQNPNTALLGMQQELKMTKEATTKFLNKKK